MHFPCSFFCCCLSILASFCSDTFRSHTDLKCFDGDVCRLAFLLLFCLIYIKPTGGYFSSIKGCKCGFGLGPHEAPPPSVERPPPAPSPTHLHAHTHTHSPPSRMLLKAACIVLRAHPDHVKPVGSRLRRSCKPNNHQRGT